MEENAKQFAELKLTISTILMDKLRVSNGAIEANPAIHAIAEYVHDDRQELIRLLSLFRDAIKYTCGVPWDDYLKACEIVDKNSPSE